MTAIPARGQSLISLCAGLRRPGQFTVMSTLTPGPAERAAPHAYKYVKAGPLPNRFLTAPVEFGVI